MFTNVSLHKHQHRSSSYHVSDAYSIDTVRLRLLFSKKRCHLFWKFKKQQQWADLGITKE
ncbi:hypothetical protein C5167_043517 [Papaver somniferum]|uniref:Uncharacterized protein n=1 Tax=Papaver somniferum TaxID=3469 RepID=A0A4Y7L7N0_PAPSO|nr:hypothetical protein C5167_043517 [Papaver somniferum]